MSIATSLALTGLGGLAYKFDRRQKYEKAPEVAIPFDEYGVKVYKKELTERWSRISLMTSSFLSDFFSIKPYYYPFKGFKEMQLNVAGYMPTITRLYLLYCLSFATVFGIYWVTITPVYFSILLVFGPFGFILTGLHSLLHANLLTMLFLRMSHFNNQLTIVCMKTYGLTVDKDARPTKHFVPLNSLYFWTYYLPYKTMKYGIGFIVLSILLSISFLPIFGPIIFSVIIAPFVSKIYFSKMFRLRGFDDRRREEIFFNRFGLYASFGIVASLTETIPIFSALFISFNTIGCTLLGIEMKLLD
ncbi:hypothetical protein NCAS_0F01590 [Naumovozyma castellii]|uniref:Outer spore wall protein RRT8 n=1 Tax=Naumovozyma castellii TaxID=27288 RepID=G0VGM2_NAUCA|nr:hypothetical protein NCAS_0F01590 [Naumovozyma castellii CBS 4309]CCC70643.1 hypothetical protein NCAS_0F01590 [Naumovozyma castellii CBS 4309]